MSTYARDTRVSVEQSCNEIKRTLMRYGASQFMYVESQEIAVIAFVFEGTGVQFKLPLPDKDSDEFRLSHNGTRERNPRDQEKVWEQACRQRWRALALGIKAKLEMIESGITEFRQEFLAHIIAPGEGGKTIRDMVLPALEAKSKGQKVELLPWGGG